MTIFRMLNPTWFNALNQTRWNIGVICAINFEQKNQLQPFLQLSLSKQFCKYLLPKIGIRIKNKIPFNQLITKTFMLVTRKGLFKLRGHNRSGFCKEEVVECFVTPEYFYPKKERQTICCGILKIHFQCDMA